MAVMQDEHKELHASRLSRVYHTLSCSHIDTEITIASDRIVSTFCLLTFSAGNGIGLDI